LILYIFGVSQRRSLYSAIVSSDGHDSRSRRAGLSESDDCYLISASQSLVALPENRPFFTSIGYFSYPSVQDDSSIAHRRWRD
jgi:hypothetical protein